MYPAALPLPESSTELLSPSRCQALLQLAQSLDRGAVFSRLQGRNIAVLCLQPDEAALASLEEAASSLGARLARLDAQGWLEDSADSPALLRMLERLYDAVDCEGLPAERAQALQRQCALPVLVNLSQTQQAVKALAPQLRALRSPEAHPASLAEEEVLLVQALLVSSLGA